MTGSPSRSCSSDATGMRATGADRTRAPARTWPRGPAGAASATGWVGVGAQRLRRAERPDLDTVRPSARPAARSPGSASNSLSPSWSGTSRQLTLAWAWAGMIVFEPSPVKPPQIPLTSSVGRMPDALEDREARLAGDERGHADLAAGKRLSSNGRQLISNRSSCDGGDDVVVEARDQDGPVVGLERGDDPGERVGRVLHRSAEATGMQVDRRAGDVDLGVQHAPQRRRDRRQVAFEEARVADDHGLGPEPVPVRLEPGRQVRAGDSSSPSKMKRRLSGRRPRVASSASAALRCMCELALVVRRRRGRRRARRLTNGSNGAVSHSSIGSTGCTS